MQITRGNLRTLIREMLLEESAKPAYQIKSEIASMTEKDFDVENRNVRYPYGRNRGDVRSTTVYTRKDGKPFTADDVKLYDDLSASQEGDPMAALGGIYTYKISDDGMKLTVQYYKHTAG